MTYDGDDSQSLNELTLQSCNDRFSVRGMGDNLRILVRNILWRCETYAVGHILEELSPVEE